MQHFDGANIFQALSLYSYKMEKGLSGDDTIILQCVRDLSRRGGVSEVVSRLEEQFLATGADARHFTLDDVLSRNKSILYNSSKSIFLQKLLLLRDVLAFSIKGSYITRRKYRYEKNIVSLSHNDLVWGDIYVNHGLHKAMIFKSRHPYRIMFRNPLHVFLLVREWLRIRLNVHRYIVCFCKIEEDNFVEYYPKAKGKVVIIPNGVNTGMFRPVHSLRTEKRKEIQLGAEDFILMFVGHEFERKGLGYVIESLQHLPEKVCLCVVGGGAEENIRHYRKMSERLHLGRRVRFLGTRADIPGLLNACDVFVLPTSAEAWPLVGLEAMACGVPALMTPVGGIPEYLKDGVNGFFIERDASDIAEKVQRLMSDPELMGKMKNAARETSIQYSWETVARKYLSLIRKVAREKAADA